MRQVRVISASRVFSLVSKTVCGRCKRLMAFVLHVDFFHQTNLKEANIQELKRVMVFTCRGDKEPIEFRHLESDGITEAAV